MGVAFVAVYSRIADRRDAATEIQRCNFVSVEIRIRDFKHRRSNKCAPQSFGCLRGAIGGYMCIRNPHLESYAWVC